MEPCAGEAGKDATMYDAAWNIFFSSTAGTGALTSSNLLGDQRDVFDQFWFCYPVDQSYCCHCSLQRSVDMSNHESMHSMTIHQSLLPVTSDIMKRQQSLGQLWNSAVAVGPTQSLSRLLYLHCLKRRSAAWEHAIAPGTPLATSVRLQMHGEIKLQRCALRNLSGHQCAWS
jgi:hypothetical protein